MPVKSPITMAPKAETVHVEACHYGKGQREIISMLSLSNSIHPFSSGFPIRIMPPREASASPPKSLVVAGCRGLWFYVGAGVV